MECQIFRNNSREIRNLLRENTSRAKCVVSSACAAEGKHSKTRRLSRDTFSRVRHQLNIASRVTLLNNLHPSTVDLLPTSSTCQPHSRWSQLSLVLLCLPETFFLGLSSSQPHGYSTHASFQPLLYCKKQKVNFAVTVLLCASPAQLQPHMSVALPHPPSRQGI